MLFDKNQIDYMKSIGLDYDFENLSDDESAEIEDKVGDQLQLNGLNEDYSPNSVGLVCESILDRLR